jgi:GNAT superfamily N-acetyltransferase
MFRKATPADLTAMMTIINEAKQLLKNAGSPQWQNGYPNIETLKADVLREVAYVLEYDTKIAGMVVVQPGIEDSYTAIGEGSWESVEAPYATIHRIASANAFKGQGIGKQLLAHAVQLAPSLAVHNVRIDTHRFNKAMQRILAESGFTYCGKVYVKGYEDNERLAYQKIVG